MVTVEIIESHKGTSNLQSIDLDILDTWTPKGEPLVAHFGPHESGKTFYTIYKIQFIALCKTTLGFDVVAAFFLGEKSLLDAAIMTALSGNYSITGNSFLFDYRAYKDLCQSTGEIPLTIDKYISKMRQGSVQPNSFLLEHHIAYNSDQQRDRN